MAAQTAADVLIWPPRWKPKIVKKVPLRAPIDEGMIQQTIGPSVDESDSLLLAQTIAPNVNSSVATEVPLHRLLA